jgi:hypothetical protein
MTIRQRKVIKELVEYGGTMSSAMRKAGYSDAMIKNPQKVTKSKGFKEILEIMGINDNALAKTLKEGLEAVKIVKLRNTYTAIPDFSTRHKFLETTLELKGYIGRNSKPNLDNVNVVFVNNIPRPSFDKKTVKQLEK